MKDLEKRLEELKVEEKHLKKGSVEFNLNRLAQCKIEVILSKEHYITNGVPNGGMPNNEMGSSC